MNTIINGALRLFGFGKAVDALDGETSKAYIGGLGMILTGAATLLGGLAGIAAQVVAAHGGGDYIALVRDLPHNPSAGLVLAGAAAIGKGISAIGQRHAVAKLSNQLIAPIGPQTPSDPAAK